MSGKRVYLKDELAERVPCAFDRATVPMPQNDMRQFFMAAMTASTAVPSEVSEDDEALRRHVMAVAARSSRPMPPLKSEARRMTKPEYAEFFGETAARHEDVFGTRPTKIDHFEKFFGESAARHEDVFGTRPTKIDHFEKFFGEAESSKEEYVRFKRKDFESPAVPEDDPSSSSSEVEQLRQKLAESQMIRNELFLSTQRLAEVEKENAALKCELTQARTCLAIEVQAHKEVQEKLKVATERCMVAFEKMKAMQAAADNLKGASDSTLQKQLEKERADAEACIEAERLKTIKAEHMIQEVQEVVRTQAEELDKMRKQLTDASAQMEAYKDIEAKLASQVKKNADLDRMIETKEEEIETKNLRWKVEVEAQDELKAKIKELEETLASQKTFMDDNLVKIEDLTQEIARLKITAASGS